LIIRKTSPAARIANGAKYGSSVLKFSVVRNASVVTEKYAATASVITMTLPSRSVSSRRPRPIAPAPTARVRGSGARESVGDAVAPLAVSTGIAYACATPAVFELPS
jgi:hypothetical protein